MVSNCMTLRVAFAGSRDLDTIDRALLEKQLGNAFALLRDAFASAASAQTEDGGGDTILDAHGAALGEGFERQAGITLMTGFAIGADRLAVSAWRNAGIGDVHAVFPFAAPDAPGDYALTHGPGRALSEFGVSLTNPAEGAHFDRITVLDGDMSEVEFPPRSGHLELCRFLVRWADIAIVVWDGGPAGGPGGTADLVAFSLGKKIPIIWVDRSTPELRTRVIVQDRLWADINFAEFVNGLATRPHLRDEVTSDLAEVDFGAIWRKQFGPPRERLDEELSQPRGHGHRLPTRKVYADAKAPRTPKFWWVAELFGPVWDGIYHLGASRVDPMVPNRPDDVSPLIDQQFEQADRFASQLGRAHRGTQFIILLIAPLAVLLATLPVVDADRKWLYVLLELLAVLVASRLHHMLKHYSSHRIWSDTRRLAERLRVLRATWPIGRDVMDRSGQAAESWTEWHSRVVRRAAGPSLGFLGKKRKEDAITFALSDPTGILVNQQLYHETNGARAGFIRRVSRELERFLLGGLILSLGGFLIAYVGGMLHVWPKPPSFLGGLLLMASAVLPVFTAALLALEDKFGLVDQTVKSAALGSRFKELITQITIDPNLSRDIELLESAGLLLLDDVDKWRDAAARRSAASF